MYYVCCAVFNLFNIVNCNRQKKKRDQKQEEEKQEEEVTERGIGHGCHDHSVVGMWKMALLMIWLREIK